MKEYIDVEVLKQQDFQDFSNTDVIHAIDNCPRVDVEPVRHGHWIPHEFADSVSGELTEYFKCSSCKNGFTFPFKRCPGCGAKMDEEAQK